MFAAKTIYIKITYVYRFDGYIIYGFKDYTDTYIYENMS